MRRRQDTGPGEPADDETPIPRLWTRVFGLAAIATIAISALATAGLAESMRRRAIRSAEARGVGAAGEILQILAAADLPDALHDYDEARRADLNHALADVLRPSGIVKLKVYDAAREIVHSTDPSVIGRSNPGNDDLEAALAGQIVSELKAPGDIWDLDGELRPAEKVVETYIPIRRDGRVVGALETYADVSGTVGDWTEYALPILGIVLLVIVPTFVALGLMMRRLDHAIARRTAALRLARDDLATLIDTTNSMVVTVTPDLVISAFNQKASEVTGLARDVVLGRPIRDVLAPGDEGEPFLDRLVQGIAGESSGPFACSVRATDGAPRVVSWSVSQLRGAGGQVLGASAFGQDITGLDRLALYEQILPICSYCKQIRDASGGWTTVETYVTQHSEAQFSHGVCPHCMERARNDLAADAPRA